MMTNIKKAASKIQKAKETITYPANTKKEKVDSDLQTPVKMKRAIKKVSEQELKKMIANNAYFRAQRRGFALGCEQEDWLAAEAEINAIL